MTNNLQKVLNGVDENFLIFKIANIQETHKGDVKDFLRQVFSEEINIRCICVLDHTCNSQFPDLTPGSVALYFDYRGTTIEVVFSKHWLFLLVKDGGNVVLQRKGSFLTFTRKDGSSATKWKDDNVGDGLNELVRFFKSETFNELLPEAVS